MERPESERSAGAVHLRPDSANGRVRVELAELFTRSAVLGTAVEYLAAPALRRDAGPGTLTVRAIPETRVIDLTFTGRSGTAASLRSVIRRALADQRVLGDGWQLALLEPVKVTQPAGPTVDHAIAGSLALAALAGLVAFVLLGGPGRPGPRTARTAR